MINLSSFIRHHALRDPARTALIFEDEPIGYGEFLRRIEKTAGFLKDAGIRPGDVVAVLMKNSPAFLEIAFATSHAGAVFLPVNYRLAADEVDYILRHAGAKLLFVDDEFVDRTAGFAPAVVLNAAARSDTTVLSGGSARIDAEPRRPDDLFRLMYTSGTTDRPKGVMHSYSNYYWKNAEHVIVLGLDRNTRLLTVGPLYHVGAFDLPGTAVLQAGGTMILHRDFEARAALAAIERHRPTGAWFAPVMTGALLACPERERFDTGSLLWAVAGGERTPEPRIRQFGSLFPNARYVDAYGLTESCSGDTFMEAGREIEKIGSTGRATPHVAIAIKDEAGCDLPAGTEGEICLRGPKITAGYWKDPERTAAAFFGDWFRTGDVGYLDAEGFLFLTDRKKDMIVTGGENVASSEVERVLYESPEIAECAVIGMPDPKWGERVTAVVVLREGTRLDPETLIARCRDRLAGFKTPKEVVFRETLPRNPSGKILKRVLREDLA